LASIILGGRDIIKEFVAAEIWLISHGWAPTEIVNFNVNWAAQVVPFPRFGIQLKDSQSAEDFMKEVEKKVNAMIGESTMNEYRAYKNLVKHKRRINQVFSEVCGDKSFKPRRPGLPVKIPVVAVASCSAAPLRASRGRSSKKAKEIQINHLLPQFALRGLNLLNPINERENLPKLSQTQKCKQLPASPNLAERRLRRM
jgi:hypothetical protein